jgi:nucleoside-diphosphate-sugar epimerase
VRALVTGGAGFLGLHLARRLTEAGVGLKILDTTARRDWADGLDVEHVHGDVRDPSVTARAVRGVDAVVHAAFAAPQAGEAVMREVNVGGTRALCRAMVGEGVSRLVVVSSTIVEQTDRSVGLARQGPLHRLNVYRATRREAEGEAVRHGLEVAVARPKTFLGPGGVGAFRLVFEAIRKGSPVPIPGCGANTYQLLDVRDFAAGLHQLLAHRGTGVFRFGAVEYSTVAVDLQALVDHAATGARVRPVPRLAARVGLRALELAGVTPLSDWYQCAARGVDSVADVSRARTDLGWEPARSNARSLVEAYDWYATRRAAGVAVASTHPVPRSHRVVRRLVGSIG